MKTRVTFLAAIIMIASFASFATVRTVSNHPLGGAQYSSLWDAYNAAVNGDTLIIEGTGIEYSMPNYNIWDKQLTVLGAGINSSKQNFYKSVFSTNYPWGQFYIGTSGSGSNFFGITFSQQVVFAGPVNNLSFANCQFLGQYQGQGLNTNNQTSLGLVFRNCFFNIPNGPNIVLGGSAVTNVSLFNCVLDGRIIGSNNNLNVLLIDHCLFLSTISSFENLNTATISNSIFMNAYPTSSTNSTFLNNICRVAGTMPPTGNSGSGNIENTDPLLVNYTYNSFYSPAHDYDIQSGSPCELAGTGGTDIGVHGGASNFSEQGEPLIAPVVRSVVITTPVVSANGTLSVDVTASKPAEE